MKKLLFIAGALFLFAGVASAQDENKAFSHLSVGLGVGTTGVEFQVATPLNKFLALRAGYSFMPKISPSFTVDFDSKEAWLANDPKNPGEKIKEADIKGELHMGDFKLLVDYYPFNKGSFHVTGGFFLGKSILANAYNTSPVVSDEKHANGNYKYWGTSGPELGTGLKSYTVVSDKQGNINADAKVNSFKPYLGIGFGNPVPKKALNVSFDFGVQFWGKPSLWTKLSDNNGQAYQKVDRNRILNDEDYCEDIKDGLKIAEKIFVYPVLTVRLNGRIF